MLTNRGGEGYMMQLNSPLSLLQGTTILVVGDVMLDRYQTGSVERISPEAPVPVLHLRHTEHRPGGAANVALNVQALGADALLLSVVGADAEADALAMSLENDGLRTHLLHRSVLRPTTVKTRLLARTHQLLRVDVEVTTPLHQSEEELVLQSLRQVLEQQQVHGIILQDYNKGVLTPKVITATIALGKEYGIPTAVDPKQRNFWAYGGATLFKPNLREAQEALGVVLDPAKPQQIHEALQQLRAQMPHQYTLLTAGEYGMWLAAAGETPIHLPAHARTIADVCGAGDTVISVAATAMAAGMGAVDSARLANMAGGLVCEYVGVVPVPRERLNEEWLHYQRGYFG